MLRILPNKNWKINAETAKMYEYLIIDAWITNSEQLTIDQMLKRWWLWWRFSVASDRTIDPHHKWGKSWVGIKSVREKKHNTKET